MVGRDSVENLMVELRALAGFFGVGDVLAQVIDADAHAGTVDGLGNAHSVGGLRARYETARNPPTERGSLGKIAQRTVFRKIDEERPQHELPANSGMIWKGMPATCRN